MFIFLLAPGKVARVRFLNRRLMVVVIRYFHVGLPASQSADRATMRFLLACVFAPLVLRPLDQEVKRLGCSAALSFIHSSIQEFGS